MLYEQLFLLSTSDHPAKNGKEVQPQSYLTGG